MKYLRIIAFGLGIFALNSFAMQQQESPKFSEISVERKETKENEVVTGFIETVTATFVNGGSVIITRDASNSRNKIYSGKIIRPLTTQLYYTQGPIPIVSAAKAEEIPLDSQEARQFYQDIMKFVNPK